MGRSINKSTTSSISWAGRHPFPPEEKRPFLLTRETSIPRVYGTPPHQIATWLHVSTDRLTCTEFVVHPGEYFDPPDIHSGEEVYYILEGTATVVNPGTGHVYTVEEGDVFRIPRKTWHQTFNFGNRRLTVLCSFAPELWPGGDPGAIEKFTGEPVFYKANATPSSSKTSMRLLGSWPSDKRDAETGGMTVIKKGDSLDFIHGAESHILVSFFVSDDLMHVGTMTIHANRFSDPEEHKGDEVFYVIEGAVSVIAEEPGTDATESKSVSTTRFEVLQGERFLIPEGFRHRYFNAGDSPAKLLFTIAPEL